MWTKGENIDKTAFTFSAGKKKRIQYFWKYFSKMSSWKKWKSTKRKQIEGLGALKHVCKIIITVKVSKYILYLGCDIY